MHGKSSPYGRPPLSPAGLRAQSSTFSFLRSIKPHSRHSVTLSRASLCFYIHGSQTLLPSPSLSNSRRKVSKITAGELDVSRLRSVRRGRMEKPPPQRGNAGHDTRKLSLSFLRHGERERERTDIPPGRKEEKNTHMTWGTN